MRKLITFLAALAMMMLLFCGMAAAEVISSTTIPTEPFSWEYLATIAGATLATMLVVQLLKLPLGKVWKIPTRLIVYLIALIISLLATHFTVGLTWENGILTAVNAVIIGLAAMGAYEVTLKKLEKAEDPGNG